MGGFFDQWRIGRSGLSFELEWRTDECERELHNKRRFGKFKRPDAGFRRAGSERNPKFGRPAFDREPLRSSREYGGDNEFDGA